MTQRGDAFGDLGPVMPSRGDIHAVGIELQRAGAAVCDRTRDRAAFDADMRRAALNAVRRAVAEGRRLLRAMGEEGEA